MSRDPGVEVVAGGQEELPDAVVRGVTPSVTDEWYRDLLAELLPHAAEAVYQCGLDQYGEAAWTDKRSPPLFAREILGDVYGVDPLDSDPDNGLAGIYADAITRYTAEFHGIDDPDRDHVQEYLVETLTSIGTGKGVMNAGIDALDSTIGAVLGNVRPDIGLEAPLVRVYLDVEAWADLEDARTGRTALRALSALAAGTRIQLVVTSPQLAKTLASRYSGWLEAEAGLTDLRSWWSDCGPLADVDENIREVAADALANLSERSGRVQLLAALSGAEGHTLTVKALKRHGDVDVAEGSVGRYLGDLEAQGLTDVSRRTDASNSVSLTPAGEIVVDHITADLSIRDPSQATLRAALTPTPQANAGAVYRPRQGRGDPPSGLSADGWLADTDDPDGDAGFVQWLDGPDTAIDRWAMHNRLTAAKRTDGINLVDERIDRLEDGRVSYISAFGGEALVVLQWGGPMVTLARLANALLSRKALSKVLGPDHVGDQWQDLYGGPDHWADHFDADLEDLMRWGSQIGWFGEDEVEWPEFFDRIGGVRARSMKRLGQLAGSDDFEQRGELLRDLHGLVATATALYDAADVDVSINLRIPDVHELRRDELRFRDFLKFFAKTIPKQAMYGSESGRHSFWRTCMETREEKLKKRLPVEYDEHRPEAELTASWIVTGPSVTDLQDDLANALQSEIYELRERVLEGVEGAPVLDVPVVNACSFGHIKSVIKEFATAKNYSVDDGGYLGDRVGTDLNRLARLFIRCLSTEDRPYQCSPTDVAEALLRIARSNRINDYLSAGDVEYAIAQLPSDRVLPAKLPSKTAMFQAMLDADGAIGRSEIIEAAGISESTYDRHIDDVRAEFGALGLVEETSVQGRAAMTATIEPWWEAAVDGDRPDDAAGSSLGPGAQEHHALFELADALGLDVDSTLFGPAVDLEAIYTASSELRSWSAFLTVVCGQPPTREDSPPPRAKIGRYPREPPEHLEQLSIQEATRFSTDESYANPSPVISTDGGREGLE